MGFSLGHLLTGNLLGGKVDPIGNALGIYGGGKKAAGGYAQLAPNVSGWTPEMQALHDYYAKSTAQGGLGEAGQQASGWNPGQMTQGQIYDQFGAGAPGMTQPNYNMPPNYAGVAPYMNTGGNQQGFNAAASMAKPDMRMYAQRGYMTTGGNQPPAQGLAGLGWRNQPNSVYTGASNENRTSYMR